VGEVLEEERAVAVREIAAGESRGGEVPAVELHGSAVHGAGGEQHALVRPVHAAGAGDVALVEHGEAFGDPRRLVLVGKEERRAAEHILREAPPAARAIQVEHVRELVRDDQLEPIIVVAERHDIEAGARIHEDAVGGVRRGGPIGEIDVVGDDEVDGAARRVQSLGERRVGLLGVHGGAARRLFFGRCEVDGEVGGAERAPVGVGHDLRARAGRRHRGA